MNFENFYLSERYTTDSNERFLSTITNVENWQKIIELVVYTALRNNVKEDLEFLIRDPSKQFGIKLIYSNGEFEYSLEDGSKEWLKNNNLTSQANRMGFYFDKVKDALVIKRHGEEFILPKRFKKGEQLNEFLNVLFFMNKYCKAKSDFALVYYLEFVDNLSKESADKIKQNPLTPNWVRTILKGDEPSKERGLFNLFKR
jgi:hypothetical protein